MLKVLFKTLLEQSHQSSSVGYSNQKQKMNELSENDKFITNFALSTKLISITFLNVLTTWIVRSCVSFKIWEYRHFLKNLKKILVKKEMSGESSNYLKILLKMLEALIIIEIALFFK